jgi:hypothetical protein
MMAVYIAYVQPFQQYLTVKNHPATPLSHMRSATLKQKFTVWIKVARQERGALLGRGMRR